MQALGWCSPRPGQTGWPRYRAGAWCAGCSVELRRGGSVTGGSVRDPAVGRQSQPGRVRFPRNERGLIAFAGLRGGPDPAGHLPARRPPRRCPAASAIVLVVVVLSVAVQGSPVPTVARLRRGRGDTHQLRPMPRTSSVRARTVFVVIRTKAWRRRSGVPGDGLGRVGGRCKPAGGSGASDSYEAYLAPDAAGR
jgi:hypothetical protein